MRERERVRERERERETALVRKPIQTPNEVVVKKLFLT